MVDKYEKIVLSPGKGWVSALRRGCSNLQQNLQAPELNRVRSVSKLLITLILLYYCFP